jgi:hypothetical protein
VAGQHMQYQKTLFSSPHFKDGEIKLNTGSQMNNNSNNNNIKIKNIL